jgi:hypothetical protein
VASAPIVAERALYFVHPFDAAGVVNGGHAVLGETVARLDWDFAEGTTLAGFQEYLTIQNPNPVPANVALTFGTESSPGVAGPVVTKTLTLAPTSRATVNVNDPAQGIGTGVLGHATHVGANVPILVERPLYFDRVIEGTEINGATASFGTAPSQSLFLGEGNVLSAWDEFLTLANPDPVNDITVNLTYLLEGGAAPIAKSVSVPHGARRTIQVFNASDPGGIGRDVSDPVSRGVSVQITTSAIRGVVAERPLYFNSLIDQGLVVNDGTDKPATPAPAKTWSFAEGTSLPDFLTFFTISNPGAADAHMVATYLTNLGEVLARPFTVPAHSRATIQAYNPAQVPQGALGLSREGFATTFASDVSVVVERPIYEIHSFPDIATPISGGQDVVGLSGGD